MNTRYVLTLCTALVIGGALITGSANAVGKADEKTPINDSWITAKTKIALFADSRVKGSEINVETAQGSVMIRGKVDSDAAKQAAEGIAKGIDGVKTVKNELQVVAPSKREAMDDKDDAITSPCQRADCEGLLSEESRYSCSDECGSCFADRRSSGPHDQCPSVLDCLAGSRREVREERSHGEGKGLGFSHTRDALSVRRYPINRDVGGRQSILQHQPPYRITVRR